MKITLLQEDIGTVEANGLVIPADGQIIPIAFGGTAAAKALKASFACEADSIEEQNELYVSMEIDIKKMERLPFSNAKVIEGNETWRHLVVADAFYHLVNDKAPTPQEQRAKLASAMENVVLESVKHGLKTIAMTLMGTTYRFSARESILAMMQGFASQRAEDIEIKWCILRGEDFRYAKQLLDSL